MAFLSTLRGDGNRKREDLHAAGKTSAKASPHNLFPLSAILFRRGGKKREGGNGDISHGGAVCWRGAGERGTPSTTHPSPAPLSFLRYFRTTTTTTTTLTVTVVAEKKRVKNGL